jgi:hypothetical protein
MIEENGTFTGEGGNPYGRSGTRSTVKLGGATVILGGCHSDRSRRQGLRNRLFYPRCRRSTKRIA